ncbi:MAG TPA: hypothetical protein PKA63_07185 [Oligoflexia bacterium]|nr:hypothetical protein [Oligoflexia bacterium]HMP48432.1 hypothetical protein [Oligoflexia bacterium]
MNKIKLSGALCLLIANPVFAQSVEEAAVDPVLDAAVQAVVIAESQLNPSGSESSDASQKNSDTEDANAGEKVYSTLTAMQNDAE